MSTTHTLPFVRFTKQATTEGYSVLAASAAAQKSLELLQAARWNESEDRSPSFPPRTAVLSDGTPSDTYDACSYCGDYSNGEQTASACAVAYRMRIPADALAATAADVSSVAIPVYVDRWLVDGVRISAYVADSETPTDDWTTIREGDAYLSGQLPMVTSPDRVLEEKNATLTITLPASTTADAYLYVFLTLEDYDTARGFWIEGAGFCNADEAVVTFSRSVTADSVPTEDEDYAEVTLTKPFLVDNSTETASTVFQNNLATLDVLIGTGGTDRHLVNNVKTAIAQETTPTFSTATALAASWERAPSGATTVTRIKYALQSLAGGLIKGGNVSKVVLADALPSYPDWMQVRMNLYASTSTYISSVASAYMQELDWIHGDYSANGFTNIISETLDPLGYGSGSEWTAKDVSLSAGRINGFLSFHIENIISDPPDTTATVYGFSMTPTFVTLIME